MTLQRFNGTKVLRRSRGLLLTARYLFVLATLAMICACAGPRPVEEGPSPAPAVEWLLGSEGARVAYVKTIAQPKDFGVVKGFWQRVRDFVSGAEEQPIIRPYGVLHGPSRRLYLADPGAGVVHGIDPSHGGYTVIRGTPGAPLQTPIGLAEDDEGLLYITDTANGSVFCYDPRKRLLKPFLVGAIARPTGIVFNPVNRRLYVSDTVGGNIAEVDLKGVVHRRIGSPGDGDEELPPGEEPARFNHPTDLAVDHAGQIYVTDSFNFRVTVLTPEGVVLRHFGGVGDAAGHFSRPKGIAVDNEGHVYVCDALRDAIQVFDKHGAPLLMFGRAGNAPGRFWMPSGLYIDRNDYIYVADTYNRRIQIFRFVPGRNAHAGDESKVPGNSDETVF